MREDRMFKEAKKLAAKSECNYRMGAVVAHSKVLGRGSNNGKTHPMMSKDKEYTRQIHAELAACMDAGVREIEGMDLFVCRIRKDGSFAIAKPCDTCYDIARMYGIRRIYYTISDTEFGVIHG